MINEGNGEMEENSIRGSETHSEHDAEGKTFRTQGGNEAMFSRSLCAPADLRFTGPVLVCKRLRNQEENHTGHAAAVETQTDSRPQVLLAVWGEGNPVLYVLLSGNRTRRK